MTIIIKNIPPSLTHLAYDLCNAVMKTSEFEELVETYLLIDREHLEAIVEAFDYDLFRVGRALSDELNGIYEDWDEYVRGEVREMLKQEMTADAWETVEKNFDYEKFGHDIEDHRIVVHHPSDWKIAVFHLT